MKRSAMLTKAEEVFVREFIKEGNASAAYRVAYPLSRRWKDKSVHEAASKLLASAKVQPRIAELRQKLAAATEVDLQRVVKEAAIIGLSDPLIAITDEKGNVKPIHEWPETARRAVASIEVLEEFEGTGKDRKFIGYTKKVKFWDKNAGLEKLMKHFGGYERDNEQKNPFRNLPREQLRELERLISELESQPVSAGAAAPAVTSATPGITH